MTQRVLHAAQILWPAFLVAGVLEMLVFSWVDPTQLRLGDWQPEAQTVYSVAFLMFWGLVTLSSLLSHWMMKAAQSPAASRRARRHARRQQLQHHHNA
jgi:hypothetical protein